MARQEKTNRDVSAALQLLNGTLEEEQKRIFDAGSEAMKRQDGKTARAVLDFADKVEDFRSRVGELERLWGKLQQIRDAAAPEVREIVTGKGRLFPVKPRKITKGFTRHLDHPLAAKTILSVRFPDGTVIEEKKAADTFAKAIEKIGADRVAGLGLTAGNEPLISREGSRKYPRDVKMVKGGFFVLTHCSTKQKIVWLDRIKKRLGLSLEVRSVSPGDVSAAGTEGAW